MKNKKIWLYLIILCLFSGQAMATMPIPQVPIINELLVQKNCPNGGPTKIILRIESFKVGHENMYKKIESGSIHFSDNISYTGDTLFQFNLMVDTVSEKLITVDIPKNDTSWVIFKRSDGFDAYKYFVTTKDTVEIYNYDPLYYLAFRKGGPHGAYKYDPTLPKPDIKDHQHSEHKGHKYSIITLTKEEQQLQEMRRLEEKPLTDRRSEEIKVGDKWYQRFQGETKFKLVEPQTGEKKNLDQLYQEWKDSVDSIPDDTPYKVCLFLDDTIKYRIADELIDNKLKPTGHPYRYHVTTTKGISYKLLKKYKIKLNFRNERDHIHLDSNETRFISPPLNNLQEEPSGSSSIYQSKDSDALELIWSSDMYSFNWTNQWYADDEDSEQGYDYWGPSTVFNDALWCNGTGDKIDGGPYDIRINSFLLSEPIDVRDYTNLQFRYRLLYDITPSGFDNMTMMYSYDNSYWWTFETYKGYWSGWVEDGQWLNNSDYIYLDFKFQAGWDNMYNNDRGVYIDWVQVWGEPTIFPNLTYVTPSGWDSPVVISSRSGTNINENVLYANEPVYIDWAITNNGERVAFSIDVDLVIDNVIVQRTVIPSLNPGQNFISEDSIFSLSQGLHEFRLVVDTNNYITESVESDNRVYGSLFCSPQVISFSGYLQYDYIDPPDTFTNPMNSMKVQLVDDDGILGEDVLDETFTDLDGYFALGPVDNSEALGDRQDVFLRVFAENDVATMIEGFFNSTYTYNTPKADNLLSGEYDTLIIVEPPISANFYIPDYIKLLYDDWFDLTFLYLTQIEIQIDNNSTGSSYSSFTTTMNIAGEVNNSLYSPDIYDKGVIAHEYGHHITHYFNFFDDSPGGPHAWNDQISAGLAASEGFATFYSCYFLNSLELHNFNNINNYFWYNCENGEFGVSYLINPLGTANNLGGTCEGAVAGILWDIYDYNDDDYSTFGDTIWNTAYASIGKPDNIGDGLSDGTDNLLEVLLNRDIGDLPDNILDFWDAWNQYPNLGNYFKVRNIFYEHGVYLQCCVGTTGNANNDPYDIVNIADLTFIIDFLFHNGPYPVCMEEANIDNSDDVIPNISDVTYFTEYLFNNGPALPNCRISKNAVAGYAGN